MEIKVKSYSKQSSLLSSILFFILGAILFTKADEILSLISIIVGVLLAIAGTVSLTYYYFKTKQQIYNHKNLIYGIVLLIIAIIFIFFANIVEQFIRFIVGGWILFSGIMRLINVLSMNFKSNKFLPLLIVSLLLIGVGIYTIVIGDILISTVGIIMMIYSAIEIVGYVFYTKDKQEKEEEGATSIIVPDKEEIKPDKKANIKDAKENND